MDYQNQASTSSVLELNAVSDESFNSEDDECHFNLSEFEYDELMSDTESTKNYTGNTKRKRKRNSADLISDNEIDAMLENSLRTDPKTKHCRLDNSNTTTNNDGCEDEEGDGDGARDDVDGDTVASNADDQNYQEITKVIMVEKYRDHFDFLPEGWVKVTHNSGMPIYLHKSSRVCSMSKPYFLGTGSARKHQIPLSAIPCLNYKKTLEDKQIQANDTVVETTDELGPQTNGIDDGPNIIPCAKIETAKENTENRSLSSEQVRDYCSKLFEFKTLKVMRFKSWSKRRKFVKSKKMEKYRERPTLPENTKLITFPIHSDNPRNPVREWTMNPEGKSYVCILHEYVQHVLKKQPIYKFSELENPETPYSATVFIHNMRYGSGYGSSKKSAKLESAKATLEILLPEIKDKILAPTDQQNNSNGIGNSNGGLNHKLLDDDLSFFDDIKIDDPRVSELCSKTTEPSPHMILLTCLQRNNGLGDTAIKFEAATIKHQRNQFTMTLGKHTATVVCKNKREGKQLASQGILKALHPNLKSWGSLLRLYGSKSIKSFKEKKMEEQEITLLQNKASEYRPNYAILEKLKSEMLKIYNKKNNSSDCYEKPSAGTSAEALTFLNLQ